MLQPTPDRIVQYIAGLQLPSGLLPSTRSNSTLRYRRTDTNVFFTAITLFTLQRLPGLSDASRLLVGQIQERAIRAYPLFRNKNGLNTYNFWPTRPSQHFSNGYLFHRFDHFRIPDDIDDTAMVYLTTQPRRDEQLWLKEKLAQHANGSQPRRIQNTFADYRNLRAYSTWFGQNMPVDFDACALSNLLYWVYEANLPLNEHDADSLAYLRGIVQSGRYRTEPFRCAPHYARPPLILYHLTRLMAAFSPPELTIIRPQLIQDARQLLEKDMNRVEQMLLTISLLRLGEPAPDVNVEEIEPDLYPFHFFIAGMLTAYEQPLLRRFAEWPVVQMRWQCEAHSWALVAEYLSLRTAAVG